MQGFGVVKAVPSGDTIVIYGNSKTGIAPEMQLTLAYCYAPRVARGPDSIEEPYGWESREFLRKKIIGQTIKFKVLYKVDVIDRTFATISMNDVNINEMMVENGWCKVRAENKVSGGDQELLEELLQLEETARSHSAGVWKSPAPPSRVVQYNLEDAEQFFKENKDTPLIGLIEQVRDGSTLRIFLPDTMTMINFHLAGIQAPKMEISAKTANDAPTPGEPYSKEAKQFVEIRLLNRSILVYLDGLDKFNNFYGHIEHPKGDISFELLKNGLAKCVDWSLNYRPSEDAVQMRTFETEARQKKIGIWKSTKEPKPASASHTARILEVVSGDTLVISNEPQNPLAQGQRVSLSSIRAPRLGSKKANTKDEDWAAESKETLRKLAIGKEITIKVDYTRTVTGVDGDVKYTYVTAETVGKNSINLAEEMVKRGLATVIRHKPDDDCSPIYDQLLLAEAVAKDAKRCLYNPKGYTHKNAVDLTENSTKAKSFFDFLHRHKTLSATILYMGNASRFRVYVPKENCECVFILEGIKSPSQRVGKEKSEPFAEECLAFARYHFMQREITIEIRGQDKTGNIIGYASMANKKDMGAFLLSNGYASIQEFSIEKCMNKNEYLQLEQQAKTAKKGIWVNYVAPVAKKMEETREETYDGYISYVEDDYVFIQTDRDIQRLKAVESQLENYSTKANVASAVRKNGTFVYYDKQAKKFCRILVEDVKNDKGVKRYSIYFLDYGYRDTTIQGPFYEYSNPEMIPPLVHECRFAFIRLPSSSHDLYDNAYNTYMDIIEEYTLDKKVSIHVLGRNSLNHLLIMVSTPGQPSLNVQLAKAGCVVLDRSTDLQKYPALQNEIRKANDTAINTNTGIYVFGVLDEDE